MTMDTQEIDRLKSSFRDFAGDEATPALYARLGPRIADRDEILALFGNIEPAKRRPVTLFAAVHYLILKGVDHPLARIYSAPDARGALDEAWPLFSSFCEDYEEEIVDTMRDRSVQTNEVNRCAALLPALMRVHAKTHRQLALVEVGSSAGLNLLFDRFRYDFANGPVIGPPGAQVRCHCDLRGAAPPFSVAMPPVDYRVGVDTEPIDISDENEVLWLKACIWVGDVAREQRLQAAIELARREWPEVKQGDAVKLLPSVVEDIDSDLELVIFSSWTMSWMTESARAELEEVIRSIAKDRTVWWITYEWPTKVAAFAAGEASDADADSSLLGLQKVTADGIDAEKLAYVAHHGQWMRWLAG